MKVKQILKYFIFFLAFCFYFYTERVVGVRPFAIALFMALVYCRQNVLILTPLYIGAAMIASPTLPNLFIALTPCVVIAIAYFVHYKLRRKINLLMLSVYTLISQITMLVFELKDIERLAYCAVSVLGAQIFTYCAIVIVYLILVKQLKFRLTAEEVLAGGAVIFSIGMGLVSLRVGWYTPFFMVTVFVTLAALFADKRAAFVIPVALGTGAAAATGQAEYLSLSVLYGLTACAFGKENFYFAGIGMLAVDSIFRLYFDAIGGFDYFALISPAIGAIVFLALPKKARAHISALGACFKEKQAGRAIVNRDRKTVAERLDNLSKVFYEIKDILLTELAEKEQMADTALLTEEVCSRCCATCGNETACKEALGGADTSVVVQGLVLAALDNGKATILDTPSFLSSRCKKINGMINATNDAIERHRKLVEKRGRIDEGREMLGEQMGGIAELMEELRGEIDAKLSFDTSLENRLVEELTRYNIGAQEAAVYVSGGKVKSLTLVVKESDAGKKKLTDTVDEVMGMRMQAVRTEPCVDGNAAIHFEPAPLFSVVYGERELAKEEEEINGDRHRAVKISVGKVLLILSDGMGSGENASKTSGYAVSLIESLYKAGFSYQTVVGAVGRLLSVRDAEEFNALDIACIDLYTGEVDFIKAGGRESFILTSGVVEVIEGGSLPVGITEEIMTVFEQRRLTTDSFVVMASDGVIDIMGRETIVRLLEEVKTANPDAIAELLMTNLKRLSGDEISDDASVLVAKIFKNHI
ncbi:MAG TPA: SpoIIE family protein phosphatase [Clostridia bacterium]|jgi:stage II sporulation protein E|nr:SpoIIE family protein phosphatase [Clostridia bacterium]